MHDAFDPPNFPPTTPKRSYPPPHRWEVRGLPKFRKTKPIDLTPGPYAGDTEAGLAGVNVSETYRLTSGGWTRRKDPVAYVSPIVVPVNPSPTPLSTPTLSVPALAFVARDASGSTWNARVVSGATPLALAAVGTPSLSSVEAWAEGVPVLDCTAGCFAGFKTSWAANASLSVITCADFSSPQLYKAASTFENRFQLLSSGTLRVFVANTGAGIISRWAAGNASRINVVPLVRTLMSSTLAQRNSLNISFSTAATALVTQTGTRIVIGGEVSSTGVVTTTPDARVLAIVMSQSGLAFSSADVTAISTWMSSLRAGTLL